MKTLDDLDVAGKTVLLRSDLNVPLDGEAHHRRRPHPGLACPTINALLRRGRRVDRRPRTWAARRASRRPKYRLAPVAERLGELLGKPVAFATDTVGESAKAAVAALTDGEIALLENVRFNAGETSQGRRRARRVRRPARGPGRRVRLRRLRRRAPQARLGLRRRRRPAGRRRPADPRPRSTVLKQLTEDVERPYAVVLGGSKVSDKLAVIDNLLEKADSILVGGGMVFTFLKAQGHEVGKSLLEEDQLETVQRLPAARGRARRGVRAADRHRRGHRVRRRRRPRGGLGRRRSRPTGWAWTSARSPAKLFADKLADRQDGLLERPDGRVRDGAVRRRHPRRRAGPDRLRRVHRRRRRRLGRRRARSSASTRTRSATSRPAAARAWSTWRARPSRAWPFWRSGKLSLHGRAASR